MGINLRARINLEINTYIHTQRNIQIFVCYLADFFFFLFHFVYLFNFVLIILVCVAIGNVCQFHLSDLRIISIIITIFCRSPFCSHSLSFSLSLLLCYAVRYAVESVRKRKYRDNHKVFQPLIIQSLFDYTSLCNLYQLFVRFATFQTKPKPRLIFIGQQSIKFISSSQQIGYPYFVRIIAVGRKSSIAQKSFIFFLPWV